MEAVRQHFTPEFLGRLDAIVPFAPLEQQAMTGIVQKYLNRLQSRAAAGGVQLILPEELSEELGKQCRQQGGARQARRLVQEQVEGPLAVYLLKCAKKPTRIKAKMDDGKLMFH